MRLRKEDEEPAQVAIVSEMEQEPRSIPNYTYTHLGRGPVHIKKKEKRKRQDKKKMIKQTTDLLYLSRTELLNKNIM